LSKYAAWQSVPYSDELRHEIREDSQRHRGKG
jgi:hypothetical protein